MAKRRRKIRSLIALKATEPQPDDAKTSLKVSILIGCFLVMGLFATAHFSNISTSMLWSDLMTTYRNQYNLVVHGEKDYCISTFDTVVAFSKIRQKVIHQDTALSGIELQLINQSKFVAIGVAGPSGVGKTLFTQELKAAFPWRENVQTHSWSSYNIEGHKQQVHTFTRDLSECGRNLIIIDNLESRDVGFIQEYNRALRYYVSNQISIYLTVIYVFNVGIYTAEQRIIYKDKLQALEQLESVSIVEFRKFDSNDVNDCIRHEVRNLNLTLDDGNFKEISKLIDANRSGCKNVYSKVMMYGKMQNL